jgi:hypothetical protein
MLEDELRQAFTERVELTPSAAGRADAAIRRGRATGKRRTIYTGFAAVLAFAMLIFGVTYWQTLVKPADGLSFSADPTALPQPTPLASINPSSIAGVGLDLRIGNGVLTADGHRIELSGVGDVIRVYRIPVGWIYGGKAGFQVMTADGGLVVGGGDGDDWTVSADGRRVAYVDDTLLTVAEMWQSGFVPKAHVTVPRGSSPVAFVGTKVLITSRAGSSYVEVGADGTARPTWNPSVLAVFGARSDAVAGLVDERRCLAALKPSGRDGVVAQPTAVCGLAEPTPASSLSPDGNWLVQPTATGLRFIDVAGAIGGKPADKACAAQGVRATAWVNPITVAAKYADGVLRCDIYGARAVVTLPETIGDDWHLVPRIGPLGG